MIYPFTRMVIYGVIWYQGKKMGYYPLSTKFLSIGEENSVAENRDQYPCEFSKMIEYWRNTWYQRTNENTDIQFPFGFVQVSTRN
jgi:sialate O-acetylesterase